jgi:hypothetical protein
VRARSPLGGRSRRSRRPGLRLNPQEYSAPSRSVAYKAGRASRAQTPGSRSAHLCRAGACDLVFRHKQANLPRSSALYTDHFRIARPSARNRESATGTRFYMSRYSWSSSTFQRQRFHRNICAAAPKYPLATLFQSVAATVLHHLFQQAPYRFDPIHQTV